MNLFKTLGENKVWQIFCWAGGTFGHPLYAALAFLIAYEQGIEISTNIRQPNLPVFFTTLLVMGVIRYLILSFGIQSIWKKLPAQHIQRLLARNHLIFFFFIPISFSMGVIEWEGNIIGFILMPLIIIALILLGGIYSVLQIMTFISFRKDTKELVG